MAWRLAKTGCLRWSASSEICRLNREAGYRSIAQAFRPGFRVRQFALKGRPKASGCFGGDLDVGIWYPEMIKEFSTSHAFLRRPLLRSEFVRKASPGLKTWAVMYNRFAISDSHYQISK